MRAYQATAERLLDFLQRHWGGSVARERLRDAAAADLRAYLAQRRGEGLGNASAARELSAMRAFLAWAGEGAPPPRLKGPRVKPGVPRPIAPHEALALAEEVAEDAREPWMAARDWAVLLLLYGAGLRIGEAVGLTGAVMPLGQTLSVTGKRDKMRVVPLLPAVREAVEAYVAEAPWPVARDAPLFRGARGGSLSPGTIRLGVRRAREAGPVRSDHAARAAPQLRNPPARSRR